MDFFQSQDVARKNTKKLILLFVLAILTLVVLTNILFMVVFGYLDKVDSDGLSLTIEQILQQFNGSIFLIVGAGVVSIITIASISKLISLSGGGTKILEMMDGEIVVSDSGDENKQMLLNVVEEMAIASASPVPLVFLLKEPGINAFAAGHSSADAVIGVTRGAIELLSRDQLQGVIAHEYSHILNGDMRLNIRLIGILHGILMIGMIGYFILRTSSEREYTSDTNSKNSGAFLAFGYGLVILGYAGTFFGNWIKAAVSRQREFLADASAVKFTRNPDGIGGALKCIGAVEQGSLLKNPHAAAISHTLFSEGIRSFFSSLFATHPPLQQRIKRILPDWNGDFEYVKRSPASSNASNPEQHKNQTNFTAISALTASEQIVNSIGNPQVQNLQYAREIINGIPPGLQQAVHEPHGARAVLYSLLLDNNESMCKQQLQYIEQHADAGVYDETIKYLQLVRKLDVQYRLSLIELALPALRQLSRHQVNVFKQNLQNLIKLDSKTSIFEWVLQKIVFNNLAAVFDNKKPPKSKYASFKPVKQQCTVLFSLLVYSNKQQSKTVQQVFSEAQKVLDIDIHLMNKENIDLNKVNLALDELNKLHPLKKPQLLKACIAAIMADKVINSSEVALLRAISDTLDCPIPPFVF